MPKVDDNVESLIKIVNLNISSKIRSTSTPDILLDSGANANCFKDQKYFTHFDPHFDPRTVSIILADGTKIQNVAGRGTVRLSLTTADGSVNQIEFPNSYWLPDLSHRGIISIPSGLKQQHSYCFAPSGSYMLVDKTKYPFSKNEDLFFVNATRISPGVARTIEEWHAIMGHLNIPDLLKMPSKVRGMIIKHPDRKARPCHTCIKNKTKVKLPRTQGSKGIKPLSSIHLDIAMPLGSTKGNSFGNYKYYASFVCDLTGYMWCRPMKSRADILSVLNEFLAFATQYWPIQGIRTDNAPELTSREFNLICKAHNIWHAHSVPYYPNRNGVAERGIGTIGMKARCMLNSTHLPHYYWPFAVEYAAELHNRSPLQRTNITPYSEVHRRMPDATLLRRFGSTVFASKFPGEIFSKLDTVAIKGTYLGICKENQGNWILKNDKQIMSYPYLVSSSIAPDLNYDSPQTSDSGSCNTCDSPDCCIDIPENPMTPQTVGGGHPRPN